MAVITRLPLGRRAASGLQPGHADPGADQSAGIGVGHGWVGEDVEHLIEQTTPVDLHACALHQTLVQLVAGARVRSGQRLVQQLYQLVEDLDVGLGQRRQQDRMSAVDIGALQRLVGGPAADPGQHPPPTGRQHRQIQSIGAVRAQELQLGQLRLDDLRGGGRGRAAQPRQPGHSQCVIDVQQGVQPGPAWRVQQRGQPVICLRPRPVAGSGNPARQRVHRRAHDPFVP